MKTSSILKKTGLVLIGFGIFLIGITRAEDPCSRFGEEALRTLCGLESEIEIRIEAGGSSRNPYCSYDWPAIAKRKMKVGRTEIEVDQENKVMIIYPDIGSTPPRDAFEASIKVYPDPQTLDGIGEVAVWSEQRKQLTAVVNGRLYHVHVDHHDSEEDQSYARKILEALTS